MTGPSKRPSIHFLEDALVKFETSGRQGVARVRQVPWSRDVNAGARERDALTHAVPPSTRIDQPDPPKALVFDE